MPFLQLLRQNCFLFRKLCSNYKIQIRCTKPFHKTVWTFGLSCQKITWSFDQISAKYHLVNGIHIPLYDEVRKSILVIRLSLVLSVVYFNQSLLSKVFTRPTKACIISLPRNSYFCINFKNTLYLSYTCCFDVLYRWSVVKHQTN